MSSNPRRKQKQTRRVVKLPDELFARFQAYCKARSRPMSSVMEEILGRTLGRESPRALTPEERAAWPVTEPCSIPDCDGGCRSVGCDAPGAA